MPVAKIGGIKARLKVSYYIEKEPVYICHYCNAHKFYDNISVDHMIPKSKGGSSSDENLAPCCYPCNREKANMDYEAFKNKVL